MTGDAVVQIAGTRPVTISTNALAVPLLSSRIWHTLKPAEARALVEALENDGAICRDVTLPDGLVFVPPLADGIQHLTPAGTLLAAALRSQLPRPMSEAPRDGTHVLAESKSGDRIIVWWDGFDREGWYCGTSVFPLRNLVCWWPLPPVPET